MPSLASDRRTQVNGPTTVADNMPVAAMMAPDTGTPYLAVHVRTTSSHGNSRGGYLIYAPVIHRLSRTVVRTEYLGFVEYSGAGNPKVILGDMAPETGIMLEIDVPLKQFRTYVEDEKDRVLAMFGSIEDYKRARRANKLPPNSLAFRIDPGSRSKYNLYLGGRG